MELASGAVVVTATWRANGEILLEKPGSRSRVVRWSTFNCLVKKGLVHADTSAIGSVWTLSERGKRLVQDR